MPIRILEIQQLQGISDRTDLLPAELHPLSIVFVFDVLYDAEISTRDSSLRGGTWGEHFGYKERRQGCVKLHLNGYLSIAERVFRNSVGRTQTQQVYQITEKGFSLLRKLKDAAGIE